MPSQENEPILDRYRTMRDFGASPEPSGAIVHGRSAHRGQPRFVVQRHRARRLHYDLRLEIDGVLVSWAVPKGPSLDPKVRGLAVKVEDHPLEYGWFEGLIPSGYGKGDVIVWDDGWWEHEQTSPTSGDARQSVLDGELKFRLYGRKLNGRFVLVRTKDDQWLVLHRRDEHAVDRWNADDHPTSVLSGRSNAEVAARGPAVWVGPTADELAALADLPAGGVWHVDGTEVGLTNLDKVLVAGDTRRAAVTKRDLVAYYAGLAPVLGRYLCARPVNLNRFPDGSDHPGFWHKAVPAHAPEWVRRWPNLTAKSGETREYLMVDGVACLAWLANHAALEIHPWTSTAAAPDEPSYALIDIDPGPETTWDETLTLARLFRVALDHLELVGRPKTTGQRGIQIWVPVRHGYTFDDTRLFVERLSRTVGATVPDLVSWRWRKGERGGRARLDYTQNARNKTLVAPYSVRPAPGAPVSVPLDWDELDDPLLAPDRWSVHSIVERLGDRGDPFLALIGIEQNLPTL